MYLPTHFREDNLTELFHLIQHYPLGTLIMTMPDALEVHHIPFELSILENGVGLLSAHVACENPLVKYLDQPQSVYIVFHAEQHYISPNWYVEKQQHHRTVPTWNYRVVHVQGVMKRINDEKYLRGILAKLTRRHESTQEIPWKIGDAPPEYIQQQLNKIVAVQVDILSLVGKFKVSQNRSVQDRDSIVKNIEQSSPAMANAIRKYTQSS